MQTPKLASLNKHLSKIEKNLARIQAFQEKGCAVDSLLGESYLDLRDLGAYLKIDHADKNTKDQELAVTTERYKNLLVKYEAIADDVEFQGEGMVMASNSTLPDFFCRITSHNRLVWRFFERITTVFGVGMIGFTLTSLTYFLVAGNIPFIQFQDGGMPGKGFLFVVGIILGLCVHEFAHGVVLANNGIKIKRVGAMAGSMVGGFVEADETTFFQAEPGVHLRFNASSIGTNALLGVILVVIGLLTSSQLLLFLALGNLFFGLINSFPISPLDGGWVYEDLIKTYLTNKNVKAVFLSAPMVFFILWIVLFARSALL